MVAKNKAGPSDPSDASDSVVCKPRFCKFISLLLLVISIVVMIIVEDTCPIEFRCNLELHLVP